MERAGLPDDYNFLKLDIVVTLTSLKHTFNSSKPLNEYFHIFRKKTINSFMIHATTKRHNWFPYILFTDLRNRIQNRYNKWWSKYLCICANICNWIHWFSPSYDISSCLFLLKFTYRFVSGLRSYRDGLLWLLFGCCTTCENIESKWYYYPFFAHCPKYHSQLKKNCYRNNYFQGIIEIIIFKLRFQGY